MTSTLTTTGFSQDAFEAFLDQRDEPDWCVSRRRQAFEAFQEMDWPDRKHEEWMRTDIRTFKLDKYSLAEEAPAASAVPTALLRRGVELGGHTVSVNSHAAANSLSKKWRDKGVVFCSVDQAVADHSNLLERYLMTQAFDPNYDRFAALHAACWSGGAFLYVPKGVVVDEPLHAYSVLADGKIDFGHLLVVLEEGAEATMMAEMESLAETDGGLHCGATELVLGANSQLRLVNLQNWGQRVWHFGHQKAVLGRDARLQWTLGALGSRLAKVNQHVALAGAGAHSQVNGVMFTEGRQHLSYHTLQHHQAPHTRSDFLYKAALQDKSRTVWRGMIKVDAAAQRTDGYQRNDNLLLSTTSRADSIPGLEIEADDVRCTHGSTTGRVDDEQIFYCRSRGFTRKEAIRAIVIGFFQQIFDRVTIESVRESLGLSIARKVREYE